MKGNTSRISNGIPNVSYPPQIDSRSLPIITQPSSTTIYTKMLLWVMNLSRFAVRWFSPIIGTTAAPSSTSRWTSILFNHVAWLKITVSRLMCTVPHLATSTLVLYQATNSFGHYLPESATGLPHPSPGQLLATSSSFLSIVYHQDSPLTATS